jgi:hypothetical protein
MTPDEIEAEYWACHFTENPATESSEDEDYNEDEIDRLMATDEWKEVYGVGQNRD